MWSLDQNLLTVERLFVDITSCQRHHNNKPLFSTATFLDLYKSRESAFSPSQIRAHWQKNSLSLVRTKNGETLIDIFSLLHFILHQSKASDLMVEWIASKILEKISQHQYHHESHSHQHPAAMHNVLHHQNGLMYSTNRSLLSTV